MKSTLDEVELVDVRGDSSGLYKCEVVAEAPTFATDYKEAHLTVLGESLSTSYNVFASEDIKKINICL